MASAISRFGGLALRYTSRIPSRRKPPSQFISSRPFHITPFRRDTETKSPKPFTFDVSALDADDRNRYDLLSPEEKVQYEEYAKLYHEHMNSPQVESELNAEVSQALYESAQEEPEVEIKTPRIKVGLMAMGETNEQDEGEDDEFEGDDITSLGHGELEQHREMREYARIAAWEMPMLSKLAKPFSPPALDQPLRFRYTTYMGETHPAEKKIVVEFCTRDLPNLTEAQRIKLIKLVGQRYNPIRDVVKMSCEMFETQAQNKRYLGDLVDTLIMEAKDSSDMFEDVPLDFRHHKFEPPLEFPEGWKMTPERKKQLEADRQQKLLEEQMRNENGKITDGLEVIENFLKTVPVVNPTMAMAGGKGNIRGNTRGQGSRQKTYQRQA